MRSLFTAVHARMTIPCQCEYSGARYSGQISYTSDPRSPVLRGPWCPILPICATEGRTREVLTTRTSHIGGLTRSSRSLRENSDQRGHLNDVEHPADDTGSSHQPSRRVPGYGGDLLAGRTTKPYEGGQLTEAIAELDLLVQRGVYVHNSAFYGLLKRCIAQKDLVLGNRVHALTVKSGYESNPFLANHIICMYASHRRLDEATEVFAKVPSPSRQMWASIILAYARHGQPTQAIKFYRTMQNSRLKPDSRIYVAVLKACAAAADLTSGLQVHSDITRSRVGDDIFVGNSLVNMYAKCGALDDARGVFDKLPTRDVVTWNAMIAGYAQNGLGDEALGLYSRMQLDGLTPTDSITFVCLLQACTCIKALHHGRMLHTHIQERGLGADVLVGNCLITMYTKCGSLEDARRVFDSMPFKTVVTWTAMIGAYAQHGIGQESLDLYASMQQGGSIPANRVTFVCLLQACASAQALPEGRKLHAQIQGKGLEGDVVISTCLVDMYSKCGSTDDARSVFDNMPSKNMVTWTAMITGYAQNGFCQEALAVFESMEQDGVTPSDSVTFSCLLRACASIGALHQGKQLHARLQEKGLEADLVVGTCLVDMYAKCGSIEDASTVFENMLTRDVVTWTAMLAGYAQQGQGQEALALYARMRREGINLADAVAFVCLLQACGSVAALEKGKEIHAQVSSLGPQAPELFVSNALIDMYSKCGSMEDAQQAFEALPTRDIVTWSALIAGYARQGQTKIVFALFERMRKDGTHPNSVTFLSVLTACSHVGLVDEGQNYFELMTREYGIRPTIEHYCCMVDLLGRAGHLSEAMEMVKKMPFEATSEVWRCLLGACRKWRKVELARQVFASAVELDRNDAAAYILMSNIYRDSDRLEEAKEIQGTRVKAEAWKEPGHSCWIDSSGTVHTFVVGDKEHHEWKHIFASMEDLDLKLKGDGYAAKLDPVVQDLPDF